MGAYEQMTRVRTKKMGLLILDARMARCRTAETCAKAMGIPLDDYQKIESGEKAPSLPQLESFAFYLDVPLEHFWGNQALSAITPAEPQELNQQLLEIRQRIIGARIRMARTNQNMSMTELSQKANIPEDLIRRYEIGEIPIPMPDLEILAASLQLRNEEFFDQRGAIGNWRADRQAVQRFLDLPPKIRDFISQPVNLPYLQLAIRLSDLNVEKLRAVAEGLLEITY